MKTTEEFIAEMENSNILMDNKLTFPEYATQILDFQDMVCKMISGKEYHKKMRIDEALFIMESTARKKGIRSNPVINNGIMTVKKLQKELAVTMSGVKGEKLVSRTLEFMERPNTQIFRNVYITDGKDETELDAIVLTDSGIIVLEIKKIKSDITLTEDGRLMRNGDECYEKIPLGEKMALKRRLLKNRLEETIADKGLDIPVCVDSLVVFSAPQGQYIRIDDRYRKEKYCFRTGLNKRIENYIGCVDYKDEQLEQLGEIIAVMESNVKRFETSLNYDEVRHCLAEALVVLQDDSTAVAEKASEIEESEENVVNVKSAEERTGRQKARKFTGINYIAASLAGVLICGASAMLGMGIRRL